MIVRRIDELPDDRVTSADTWTSRRLLLKEDGMGFSFHETVLGTGTSTKMWYRNHVEAVYCVGGKGEIEDLETGKRHAISPGTLYALDANDRHILHSHEELRMICVFNPPLVGPETHDEQGSYPLMSGVES